MDVLVPLWGGVLFALLTVMTVGLGYMDGGIFGAVFMALLFGFPTTVCFYITHREWESFKKKGRP